MRFHNPFSTPHNVQLETPFECRAIHQAAFMTSIVRISISPPTLPRFKRRLRYRTHTLIPVPHSYLS